MLQIPPELQEEYLNQSPLDQLKEHPRLSSLSLAEAHRLLVEFQSSPYYEYFVALLQAKADAAIISVVSGFKERDLLTLVEREQVIGASTAYLEFSKLSVNLKDDLAFALTEQEPQ